MFSLWLLFLLVALGLGLWAIWFALLYRAAQEELRINRLLLCKAVQQAADEEAGKTTALRLLDELMVQRPRTSRGDGAPPGARAELSGHPAPYRDSVAIDGPLASRRFNDRSLLMRRVS
jgi:hypothetical protein